MRSRVMLILSAALRENFNNSVECVPKSMIAGLAAGGDIASTARCSVKFAGSTSAFVLDTISDGIDIAKLPIEQLKERIGLQVGLTLEVLDADLATRQALGELQTMMREEPLLRLEAYARHTAPGYCAGCAGICESVVAPKMPICDILRYAMYHHGYGDRETAADLFRRLPEPVRANLLIADYTTAEKRCPQQVPIGQVLRQVYNDFA